MPGPDLYTASTYLERNADWITAVATVVVAVIVAEIIDRVLVKRGRGLTERVAGGDLTPEVRTRLRLLRRLIFAFIVVLGVLIALWQFEAVRRTATGVLASSAVLGLIIGFAARQTLANGIAGILLAITQPIRIGDLVTFEEETGVVEDVKLSYTYIRLDDGRRLVVPNERLAASSIENHTVVDPKVRVEVSVWLPPAADLDRAIELIADDEIQATVAEVDSEGVRLAATTSAVSARDRGPVAAELRQRWLRRLREHGLSSVEAS